MIWIGLLIGLLIHVSEVIPFYARFLGVDMATVKPKLYFMPSLIIPWSYFILNFAAYGIGIGTLVRQDITISATIFSIIFGVIVPPILAAVGMITPAKPDPAPFWNIWGNLWGWGGMLNFGAQPIIFGTLVALCITYLWIGRNALKLSIKGLYSKLPKEVESEEALPYKYIWAGFIISGIVWFGLMVLSNVPIIFAIFYLVFMLVWHIGCSVYRGESGAHLGGYPTDTVWGGSAGFLHWIYSPFSPGPGADAPGISLAFNSFYWPGAEWPPLGSGLESYKLASLTKTKPRDVLIGQIISVFTVLMITFPLWIILAYWLEGWGGWAWFGVGWGELQSRGQYFGGGGSPPVTPWYWGSFTTAFIVSMLFIFLRQRFSRFPLHPVGIILGVAVPGYTVPGWLLGMLLQMFLIRTGGASKYEKIGVPLAFGLILSYGVAAGLAQIAGVIWAVMPK